MNGCMGTGKKIQILLSTYNGERYLRQQLDSYLALKGGFDLCVLIRDDGSTDGTRQILREYASQYGFKVIEGSNLGVNRSILSLLQMADDTCDYFALSDQDDVWLPEKLEIAVSLMEREAAETSSLPLLFASCSMVSTERLEPVCPTLKPSRGVNFWNAAVQNVAPGHTQVFNRALFQKLRSTVPDSVLVIDWWIYLAAAGLGKVLFVPDVTVLHRQHGDNAVGYQINPWKRFFRRLRQLRAGKGNAIALQLQAFLKCYGKEMREPERNETEDFLYSQNSFFSRWRYLFHCRFYRQSRWDTLAFRLLYLLGKYRTEEGPKPR